MGVKSADPLLVGWPCLLCPEKPELLVSLSYAPSSGPLGKMPCTTTGKGWYRLPLIWQMRKLRPREGICRRARVL